MRITVVKQVSIKRSEVKVGKANWDRGWELCLQWGIYPHANGIIEQGYRFIWKDENGNLRPLRGQACIPSLEIIQTLMDKAKQEGWSDYGKKINKSTLTPG
jgi:hypothetical protein